MTTIDKTSNINLVYFNQKIVAIKSIVKKAKINEIQKIIRKIKLLNNKKGNEAQLEKNKRKSENLKQEINEIKKLKFNEVAICSFENENTTFSQYLSKKKNLSLSEISLARISLSKTISQEIEKIKADPKIDGWKTIFIQYKARCEKRKNWKDKLSKVKEIESNLNENKNSDVESSTELDDLKESEDENENEQASSNEMKIEETKKNSRKAKDNEIENSSKKLKKEIIKEKESEEINIGLDGSDNESEPSISNEPLIKNDNEYSLSESEDDAPLDLDNYELGGFSDEEECKLSNDFILQTESEPTVSEETNLKPIVFENKHNSRMFIKQFNLDEMKDLSEIPTNSNVKTDETSNNENKSNEESDDESNKDEFGIDYDPFFLDQNGNEIENDAYQYEHEKFRNRRPYRENDYEPQSYSSYDRYQSMKDSYMDRRNGANSSFKSSLSSNNNFSVNRGKYSDRAKPQNNSRFNNNSSYNKDNNYKNHKQRDSYHKSFENKPKKPMTSEPQSLHPSWQAKKQMEDRARLKFAGKKMTFDD